MSNSLSRQVGEEGAEEGAYEGVLYESHVMERVGGVQQTGHCREQLGKESHLWRIIFLWSLHLYLTFNFSIYPIQKLSSDEMCLLHNVITVQSK